MWPVHWPGAKHYTGNILQKNPTNHFSLVEGIKYAMITKQLSSNNCIAITQRTFDLITRSTNLIRTLTMKIYYCTGLLMISIIARISLLMRVRSFQNKICNLLVTKNIYHFKQMYVFNIFTYSKEQPMREVSLL